MSDIISFDRHADATVLVFSGLAAINHVYEWTASFAELAVNLIGVRDLSDTWYQTDADLLDELRCEVDAFGDAWLACIGGSAGGFAALKFGRALGADRILAFCPQSACGPVKRALGDGRWRIPCEATPADDICGWHNRAIVHYAADEPLDEMHARRLCGAELRVWPRGGHALPHRMKEDGVLMDALQEALP
jgi:hypothetical protein